MTLEFVIDKICCNLQLGNVTEPPTRIYGGLMHKIFSLKTKHNSYAIKLLNPMIMKRIDALQNFENAEKLEGKLQSAFIPIVSALDFNGQKMQFYQNQYYYVFNWAEGKSLPFADIKKEHCSIIGDILARIHQIERKNVEILTEKRTIDWHGYHKLSLQLCPEISSRLSENLKLLMMFEEKRNDVCGNIPNIISICHGDMDSKNVLWHKNEPKIIDLECLNYGNPYIEFFELALCWSGFENCNMNYDLLNSFIKAYIDVCSDFNVDWDVLYWRCNDGRLQWLEYNIKRALMVECMDEEEKKLGILQVLKTMKQIIYYDDIRDNLMKELKQIYNN